MRVRILNEDGLARYQDFLIKLGQGVRSPAPLELLKSSKFCDDLPLEIDVASKFFAKRLEFGEYLSERLKPLGQDQLQEKAWAAVYDWLALFYFDQICPPDRDGKRNVGELPRYLISGQRERSDQDYYRHLVAEPYLIYRRHGNAARLLLHNPLNIRGDYVEQISGRQEWIRAKGVVEALTRLYYDEKLSAPKEGGQSKDRPGNLRRFTALLGQISMTYDLLPMSGKQICDLLPAEFNGWLGTRQ